MFARFINYIVARFSMLFDTQNLISQALENNKKVHERIRKSEPMIKPFILENINKKAEEIKHIRLFHS